MASMATTRLRKTFKYPDDSDGSDVSRDELDEEEQERLIDSLRAKEASDNASYNLIFSLVPLTVIFPFLYYLFSSTRLAALLCLLSITSLLVSAYTMRFIPLNPPRPTSRYRNALLSSDKGPIDRYLPYMNPAISSLLCVAALVMHRKADAPEGLWLFLLLPAVVLIMITVARRSMADIQAGIGELSGMKYDYKGA